MAFQIIRQVTHRGEIRQKTIDVPDDSLHIGRGTSNHLHLENLAVSLNHAVIEHTTQGQYILKDLTKTGATYVNGVPAMESVLQPGDRVGIHYYLLTVSQPEPAGPLILIVEEQPHEKEEPSLGLMPKLQIAQGRWSRKRLSLVLSFVVMAFCLGALGLGREGLFMPGGVSLKHGKFAEECQKCHTSWKAVWKLVPDATCQACHPKTILEPNHFGDRSADPAPACASCHLEHKGQMILAAVPDSHCVQCHENLHVKDPLIPVTTVIHSFTSDHPEFAISQFTPEKKTPDRVRFNQESLLRDQGQLKLNHQVHLAPDLKGPKGVEPLQCIDCHRVEGDGRYLQPIKYERDCMRCHDLTFDTELPEKGVTHGRQPKAVRQELNEIYADLYLRTLPKEQRRFAGVRRLPGQPPTPQELFVDDRVERAEGVLYPPKGKKCAKCHVVENINGKSFGPSASTIDMLLTETLRSSENFSVAEVRVPQRWLPFSRFDHAAHFGIPEIRAKGNVCVFCHKNAEQSKKTEDVLLPGIALCRSCHVDPGGAQAECKTCHVFHPKTISKLSDSLEGPMKASQSAIEQKGVLEK